MSSEESPSMSCNKGLETRAGMPCSASNDCNLCEVGVEEWARRDLIPPWLNLISVSRNDRTNSGITKLANGCCIFVCLRKPEINTATNTLGKPNTGIKKEILKSSNVIG